MRERRPRIARRRDDTVLVHFVTVLMEAKLWAALCALLLLIHLGSAELASQPSEIDNSEALTTESVPHSGLDLTNHTGTSPSPNGPDTNLSSSVGGSLSSDTSARSISLNGTNIIAPSEAAGPENNLTTQSISHTSNPLSETHHSTSQPPLISSTPRPARTDHTAPVDITHSLTTPADGLNDTIHTSTLSHQPTQPITHSITSAPPPEPPKVEATKSTTAAWSSSTTSTSPPQESAEISDSPAITSPKITSRPDRPPETSTAAHQTSSVPISSSPSAQAGTHAGTHADVPSQLNVGGDTTILHESPKLDPLLAGLVSAFIITAIIITLLLFLKLRRRDSRPEFRRLQDLPMDDMMEDTPLSMYSY